MGQNCERRLWINEQDILSDSVGRYIVREMAE